MANSQGLRAKQAQLELESDVQGREKVLGEENIGHNLLKKMGELFFLLFLCGFCVIFVCVCVFFCFFLCFGVYCCRVFLFFVLFVFVFCAMYMLFSCALWFSECFVFRVFCVLRSCAWSFVYCAIHDTSVYGVCVFVRCCVCAGFRVLGFSVNMCVLWCFLSCFARVFVLFLF